MNNKTNDIIIINEELFKLYSNCSRNVGVDKVIPYINLAQPFYILPILGEPLLNELQEQIAEDKLTEENKSLILKIAPSLALWTDYLALRGLAYSITQKGITKEKSENSESISEKELGEWKLDIKNQAELASELLVKYLCSCQLLYPLWKPSDNCGCNKYEETEGTAKVEKKFTIYFPNKTENKCGCK